MGRVMKLQFFIWAILGVALLITETGTAQVSEKDAQRALRGLTSIYLLVDDIDEEAKSCGITKSLIRDAFMFPASLSKIKISNDPVLTSSEFYVRVSSVIQQNPTQCFRSGISGAQLSEGEAQLHIK